LEAAREGHGMSHEIAKLLLEHAETFLERKEAIKSAMALGMPLNEIQEYLDWLDAVRGRTPPVSRKPPGGDSKRP
jgi:DNA-binding transcriptional MerR regulator